MSTQSDRSPESVGALRVRSDVFRIGVPVATSHYAEESVDVLVYASPDGETHELVQHKQFLVRRPVDGKVIGYASSRADAVNLAAALDRWEERTRTSGPGVSEQERDQQKSPVAGRTAPVDAPAALGALVDELPIDQMQLWWSQAGQCLVLCPVVRICALTIDDDTSTMASTNTEREEFTVLAFADEEACNAFLEEAKAALNQVWPASPDSPVIHRPSELKL